MNKENKDMSQEYENFAGQLQLAMENEDTEIAHGDADTILCDIAMSTTLSAEERQKLVELYEQVDKWFA
jgi:hypothetical protein